MPEVVRSNNAFALALYHRLRRREGNVLVAPACVSSGLALLHAGARGETRSQIERVLHLYAKADQVSGAYSALVQDLNADGVDRAYQVRLANALWIQDGYDLLPSFKTLLQDTFALEPTAVDFAGERAQACALINSWTHDRTGGKIHGLLRPETLPARTQFALTSALYLRASWSAPFQRSKTRDERFWLGAWNSVNVPMMHAHSYTHTYGYLEGEGFQALTAPCGSERELEVAILLPSRGTVLADLEARLSPALLESCWPRFRHPTEIEVALPKFRIEAEVGLNSVLSRLGMPLAFSTQADFSGINGHAGDLFLATAAHQTMLDVNEEGLEAAAAMQAISPDSFGEPPPSFRADRPFLFLIRDRRSEAILFLGRLTDPSQRQYSRDTRHSE
jgi:serpin B